MISPALFFVVTLLIAVILRPVTEKIRLPFSAVLVVLGFALSELAVAAGADTGLRWQGFIDLILLLLPVLIFASALTLDPQQIRHAVGALLTLAIPLLLVTAGLIAAIVYWALGHPQGFPWPAAFLLAAILAATEPTAALDVLRRMGASNRLLTLIEGESLINDVLAVVLFTSFLAFANMSGDAFSQGTALLLRGLLGGLLIGAVSAALLTLLFRHSSEVYSRCTISLVVVYGAYLFCEQVFATSGVLSVAIIGFAAARAEDRYSSDAPDFLYRLWGFTSFIASCTVYILVGVSIQVAMFQERWLAMLIAIFAVLVSRGLVLLLLGGISGLARRPTLTTGEYAAVYWGGIRGAVALALALSIPTTLPYWWTIQAMTYGVVLFGLLIQAPSMPLLGRLVRRQ